MPGKKKLRLTALVLALWAVSAAGLSAAESQQLPETQPVPAVLSQAQEKMAAAGYRMLGIKPYIAFYRIVGRNVFICRVLHGAVDYPLLYEKMSQVDFEAKEGGRV